MIKQYFFSALLLVMVMVAAAQPQGVSTYSPVGTSATTALGGGYNANNGGFVASARGICWGTAANPTTALTTKFTGAGGTLGYTAPITGLRLGTTYYVRSFVTYANGTVYGPNLSFVLNLPLITSTPISGILATGATGGGNITSDGGSAISARGVCWSTLVNPTVALTTKTVDQIGNGLFTSQLTGLVPETIYHARAYATNASGTTYGPDLVFTASNKPVTATTGITITGPGTATSGGTVVTTGNSAVTAKGVCWSTAIDPTIALPTKTADGTGSTAFTSYITGLALGTSYHVRSYATNTAGTAYGKDVVFTSLNLIPGVVTLGGIIAYIYQSGEGGYVAGQTHGFIVAPTDQGSPNWNNAAALCNNLVVNNYSDWRLPNKYELGKIYLNKVAIGGLASTYWSSEHWPAGQEDNAFFIFMDSGLFGSQNCTVTTVPVRAIRSF